MKFGKGRSIESGSGGRSPFPNTVNAGPRVVLSLFLLLGPTLTPAGAIQEKGASARPADSDGIVATILNFQDESGTGATGEVCRWLARYLSKHLSSLPGGQRVAARFFEWGSEAATIKDLSTKHLVVHGRKVRAHYVIRPGLLAASSEDLQGKPRTRVQLYADVVSVETSSVVRVEARGVGYQKEPASEPGIVWDAIDLRSEEFGRSSIRIVIRDAIERLAAEIHRETGAFVAGARETHPQGRPPLLPNSGVEDQEQIPSRDDAVVPDPNSTADAQDGVADEGVQQLLAQAQECLNSVNASREKLEALIQALQGFTSAMEQKARLLEDVRVNETGPVDAVIGAQTEELQHAVDQILPEEPGAEPTGDLPVEAGPGSGWFDRITRAVDFGFSVVERVLDIRDRLRSFRDEPFQTDGLGGQSNGDQFAGDGLHEEPYADLDGNVWQESDSTLGRLGGDEGRPVQAAHRPIHAAQGAFAGSYPLEHRLRYATAAYSKAFGSRRSPVVGAEVVEPDSGASTRTDSNGFYRLRVPARSRRLIVRIRGSQVGERRISPAGGRAVADFVVTPNSRGVSGGAARILPSRVVVNPNGSNTGTLGGLVLNAQRIPVARALVEIGRLARARTDSQGKFVFTRVPAGTHQVTVHGGDIEPKSEQVRVTANAPTEKTIQLGSRSRSQGAVDRLITPGAGTLLRGEVTDGQSRAIPGARVTVIGPATTLTIQSNAAGGFELKDLKPGAYRVAVSRPGYVDVTQAITLRAGGNERASFRMTPTNSRTDREFVQRLRDAMCEVRGVVSGVDRRPIAGTTVELRASGKSSDVIRSVTNDRGEYAMKVFQGRYDLRILRRGFHPYSRSMDLQARGSVRADVELRTGPGIASPGPGGEVMSGSLIGRVTDALTNKGIANARVSVRGVIDTTDASGQYQITNLVPGRHQVSITVAGYESRNETVEVKTGSATSRNFDLRSRSSSGNGEPIRDGQLRGRVIDDRTDRGIPNVRVSAGSASDSTDGSGNYLITNLEPRRYQVSIIGPGYESKTETVEVKAGSATNRNFELRPRAGSGNGEPRRDGQLRGRVIDDRTDRGIPNVRVSAGSATDSTDGGGNYLITNLEPRRYQVSITVPGYESKTETVEVKAGSATNRNFELRPRSGSGSGEPGRGQLRGRVIDDRTNGPISGARVAIQGRSDVSDNSGSYQINDIPPGRWQITVASAGYAGESTSIEIRAGSTANKSFDLKAIGRSGDDDSGSSGVGQVKGRVVNDKTGRPISGARVSVAGRSDTTDRSGAFLVSGVPAGRHSVRVSRFGYSSDSASVDVRQGSSVIRHFELRPSARSDQPRYPGGTPPYKPNPRQSPEVKRERNSSRQEKSITQDRSNRISGAIANRASTRR